MKFSILPFSLFFILPSIVNGDELGMKFWMTTKTREAKAMKWTIWEDRCKPISEPMDNSITFVRPSSNTCCTFLQVSSDCTVQYTLPYRMMDPGLINSVRDRNCQGFFKKVEGMADDATPVNIYDGRASSMACGRQCKPEWESNWPLPEKKEKRWNA